MRSHQHVLHRPQRTFFRKRFHSKDIQNSSGNFAGLECFDKVVFFDCLSSANVHEDSAGLHLLEEVFCEEVYCVISLGQDSDNNVSLFKYLVKLIHADHRAAALEVLCRNLVGSFLDPNDFGSKSMQENLATSSTDIPKADNGDCLVSNHFNKTRLPLVSLLLLHELPQRLCVEKHAKSHKLAKGLTEQTLRVCHHNLLSVHKSLRLEIAINTGSARVYPFHLLRIAGLIIQNRVCKMITEKHN